MQKLKKLIKLNLSVEHVLSVETGVIIEASCTKFVYICCNFEDTGEILN